MKYWRAFALALFMAVLIYAFSEMRLSYCTWGKANSMLTMQIEPRARECAYYWIDNPEKSAYVWVFQDEPYKGELEYYYIFGWVDGKFVLFSKVK